jgi:putative flippase GtrA
MSKHKIAYIYTTIAVTASCANLLLQFIFLKLYTAEYAIELSIVIATAIVLPFKYVADKKLIFRFATHGVRQDAWKFANYTFVSLFTVAVFWGVEYSAHLIFDNAAIRYGAGALGLAMSFHIKYLLDKSFVFKNHGIHNG